MNNSWSGSGTRLDLVHRVGAVVFGLGLAVFGVLGLVNRLEPFSTSGQPVLGLSSNGLLSAVSLVVAVVLFAAAVRGGRTASTVLTAVGAAFLLSGVVNVLLLEGPYNLLAFRMSNVVFSLISGGLLLIMGSWGRFTGRLPDDSQYSRGPGAADGGGTPDPVHFDTPGDVRAASELAAAERADAQRSATPGQRDGLRAAAATRTPEERVRAWRDAHGSDDPAQPRSQA